CMGLVDIVNEKILSFVSPTIWEDLVPGDVSLVVQSGMLSGAFLIDTMSHRRMGISKVCSLGNKMDVSECEILEYLVQDPDTRVIGLYLESLVNGRKFMEICSRTDKPVVLLKGGKSEQGARAAMGHTASMAGNNEIIKGAMAQAGVIQAGDFHQMMDICRSFAAYPDPPGTEGRIAVVTYTGGAGIVSSDFIDNTDLTLASLSHASRKHLETIFPDWMPVANPIDLWPAVERHGAEKAYGAAVRAVCSDPQVDGIFIHAFSGGFALNLDIETLAEEAKAAGKPLFCWLLGKKDNALEFQERCNRAGVPVFREITRAVECMDAIFARRRASDSGKLPVDFCRVPTIETNAPGETSITVMDEYRSKQLLSKADIPVTDESIAASVDQARDQAQQLGFPVVMKGLVPDMVHKTESGLVRLNITSPEEAEAEFLSLEKAVKNSGKIIVQQQVKADVELIVGLVRDPQFGPCVMLGMGGVMAEILDDLLFRVAPLDHGEAMEMINNLKNQKLLNGFRGAQKADRKKTADILVTIGRLGWENPNFQEIDINPLIISNGKPVAVDASIVTTR
ncbi:MAG TPA: acetate--CoA ligase family protein, partial [Desulfobacteraceae bacterium]|nr:acetate--CoA ligase family protein [Desulfobacteraceae bacterium]